MIKRIRIQNYKALRDVTLDLTPIHVLIGPNDSGKTSILEAIAALCRSVDHPLIQAFTGSWEGRQLVWFGSGDATIRLTANIEHNKQIFEYSIDCAFAPRDRGVRVESETIHIDKKVSIGRQGSEFSQVYVVASLHSSADEDTRKETAMVHSALAGVHSYRWDPRFLALPVAPDMNRRFRMEPSGFGLALCLDDILGYDRNQFSKLERRFTEIFPHIESIKLIPQLAYKSPVDDPEQVPLLQKSDGKGLYFEVVGSGDLIPARQMSDGVLLMLAYLAVLHLPEPPRVLLVEEPENGIHPRRLTDVLSVLRRVVTEQVNTQVLLATHSPYVVDQFEPDEVTLCQKKEDGSIGVHRLSDSKTVREQLDVFTLGEIWTAEGDEALSASAVSVGEEAG